MLPNYKHATQIPCLFTHIHGVWENSVMVGKCDVSNRSTLCQLQYHVKYKNVVDQTKV